MTETINSAGKSPDKKIVPINIRPNQVDHYKRILEILKYEVGYVDVSPMGSGKTHVTYSIAATYKLNVILVGPKTTLDNWVKWADLYGINLIANMTYQSLRGQECYDLNHKLLERVNGEYRTTPYFEECVKSGLLLIFDEYHNLKNDNTQLASAHAMVKTIVAMVRMGYKARVALLSGTPCVEKENCTSTLKMLGIITSDTLYNFNRSIGKYELVGIQEAIDKCNSYDPQETFSISCRSVNKNTVKTICYDLYTRVLKRFVVSSMPPPQVKTIKDCKNYYILMPDEDVEKLKKGIMLFRSATNYQPDIQEVDYSGINWGDITTSRITIDSAKIPSVCRLARQDLERDPLCKVLIYCNYKADMETARGLLSDYGAVIMDGSTNNKNRKILTERFQADSNECRVFVTNPKVGGVGIELDDQVGNRQRITYLLPSYFFVDQHQATARTHRDRTKSQAIIRFVYSRAFPYETGILNSMANKTQVLRNMVTDDHDSIKFPGEYEELIELTPEEIRSGIKKDMTIRDDSSDNSTNGTDGSNNTTDTNTVKVIEIPKIKSTPVIRLYDETRQRYTKLKAIVNSAIDGDPGQLIDKYHAYSLFLEMINRKSSKSQAMIEEEAAKEACNLMYKNSVINNPSFPVPANIKTEKDMLDYIEKMEVVSHI